MARGFLDSGYKVSKWILSPHHDIAIEHGPEKHPKLIFFGESWFSMMKGQILYVWICSILLRFLISGRYQTRLDSFNWHTNTHMPISVARDSRKAASQNCICQYLSNVYFPITPPAQGCQSTSQFSQPARGIWASTLPFQQQVRTSLLSRKAVAQQHVTNFEPVTCFEGARKQGGMCSNHLKSSSWLFSVSIWQHSEQACSLEVQRLTAKWWSCVVHCSTKIIP